MAHVLVEGGEFGRRLRRGGKQSIAEATGSVLHGTSLIRQRHQNLTFVAQVAFPTYMPRSFGGGDVFQ